MKKTAAEILSRVFDPIWEIPLVILLAIGFAVREGLRWRFLGLLLFIDAVVPMIFFLIMLYHKQIKDWDVNQRRQRIPLYLFSLICHMGGIWLAHEVGKGSLVSVLLVYYSIAIVFFLITLKWKISLHTGVNAVFITSLNMFYGWRYVWLYVVLCLVAWARVYQKHHTWAQVTVGAVLGGVMVWLGLFLVGLIGPVWVE